MLEERWGDWIDSLWVGDVCMEEHVLTDLLLNFLSFREIVADKIIMDNVRKCYRLLEIR